jgi:hypothetical protein
VEGITALMRTDPAEFRNPDYHAPPDTLDYGFMAEVAGLLVHAVLSSIERNTADLTPVRR